MTINEADSNKMELIYNRKADVIFPFSVANRVTPEIKKQLFMKKQIIQKHDCLFVGSNFFGNTEGLKYFITNILPDVDIHLTIVGNGMSKAFSNNEKISVFDFVDDLQEFYLNTDFVLLPIISGGGMKTKTAEAMMFGKAIVGTMDAFCGYDIDKLKGIYVCKTKEDFISAINRIYKEQIFTFNSEIHERFEEKHSISITEKRVREFFYSLER